MSGFPGIMASDAGAQRLEGPDGRGPDLRVLLLDDRQEQPDEVGVEGKVVEMRGLEPLTPAMRTRCSPS
jgi:hypothetical protein